MWLEVTGHNKHSKLLIGCILYRSNKFFSCSEWLDPFENVVSQVNLMNDDYPVLLSGDFNINMLDVHKKEVKELKNTLAHFCLDQVIDKPTRMTEISATLIDLLITDRKNIIVESGRTTMHKHQRS